MRHFIFLRMLYLIFTLLLSLVSCTEDKIELPTANEAEQEATTSDDFAAHAINRINQIRRVGARCGNQSKSPTTAVRWNTKLAAAAYRHAKDMSDNNFFAHKGSNGSKIGKRVTNVGYDWQAVSENIAKGQRSMEEVMTAWKNSPGHCKNMMNPIYTEMGMARVGNVWVQVFGKSM